jgi:hypothetical protein
VKQDCSAAELSRKVVTVDLHCHPNLLGGPHFPDLAPDVPGNMKAGGLDVGLFAVRGDYPVIHRDAAGHRYESRQPKPGELFRRSHEQLDKIIEATNPAHSSPSKEATRWKGIFRA